MKCTFDSHHLKCSCCDNSWHHYLSQKCKVHFSNSSHIVGLLVQLAVVLISMLYQEEGCTSIINQILQNQFQWLFCIIFQFIRECLKKKLFYIYILENWDYLSQRINVIANISLCPDTRGKRNRQKYAKLPHLLAIWK